MSLIDKFAPVRKKCIRKQNNRPWHDKNIDDLKCFRNFVHTNAINSGNIDDWEVYLSLKKEVNSRINAAKNTYFCNQLNDACGDSSKTWKLLNYMLPNKCKDCNYNIYDENGALTKNCKHIADIFNTFLSILVLNLQILYLAHLNLLCVI